ncbi:MAG: polyprenyl synthetase family protein [Chloroflexi bacterium]|nr:polyprenyl synthetase family protein [Chloroflexota bacterium]
MSLDSARALVAADLAAVETKMAQAVGKSDYAPLADALQGLVRSGGKRVRPTLTLLAGRFYPPTQHHHLISLAAAIESLHTATLVHDDVVDGALLRRGKSTLNALWMPSSTIMAGDFFFARAAGLVAETEHPRVIRLFAQALQIIVDGELRQAFSMRDWSQPKGSYYERIYGKTAALLELATQSPSVLGEAPPEHEQALRRFGHHLGMAFQIIDDILDFVADAQTLGKPAGSDLRAGIITLPVYYYIQQPARRDAMVSLIDGHRTGDEVVDEVVRLIRESDAIPQAHAEARSFSEKAIAELMALPSAPQRDALADVARYVVEREF